MNYTDVSAENQELINYAQLGGGILVQDNTFNDIVGCPHVDTSLIQINVV